VIRGIFCGGNREGIPPKNPEEGIPPTPNLKIAKFWGGSISPKNGGKESIECH
jgi:hypothetical protein